MAAMSIFVICIMASNERLAAAGSGSAMAAVRARGVIGHDRRRLRPRGFAMPDKERPSEMTATRPEDAIRNGHFSLLPLGFIRTTPYYFFLPFLGLPFLTLS